jgi:hypothetical protein
MQKRRPPSFNRHKNQAQTRQIVCRKRKLKNEKNKKIQELEKYYTRRDRVESEKTRYDTYCFTLALSAHSLPTFFITHNAIYVSIFKKVSLSSTSPLVINGNLE